MSPRINAARAANSAKRADAVGAIVVLGLAGLILVGGLKIPDSSYANAVLSPRDFPWIIGVLLAVAGAVQLVRNASALLPTKRTLTPNEQLDETSEPAGTTDDGAGAEHAAQNPRVLGLLVLLLLGYVLVFVWLGYVLSTFLFLIAATMALAPRKPVRNLMFAAGFSVAVYLLFTVGLNVLLPPGPLGGLL